MVSASIRTFAIPDALEHVERAMTLLWAAHPHVPEVIRIRVGIAVTEVAANIVEHATKGLDRLVRMHVCACVRDSDVVVTFVDDGIPAPAVDLTRIDSLAMPDDLAEAGRGLPLAQSALSRLKYQRVRELNRWTLVSHCF